MHVFLYFRLHAKHHKERDRELLRAGYLRHHQGTHITIRPHDRYATIGICFHYGYFSVLVV